MCFYQIVTTTTRCKRINDMFSKQFKRLRWLIMDNLQPEHVLWGWFQVSPDWEILHRRGHVLLTMRELSCMAGRTQSGLWAAKLQGFMYLGQLGAGAAGAVCTSAGICRILFRAKTLRKLTACRLAWSRGHELTLTGASCVVEIISPRFLLIWCHFKCPDEPLINYC